MARVAGCAGSAIRLARLSDVENITQCIDLAYTKYISRMGRRPAPMGADYASVVSQIRVYVIETKAVKFAGVLVKQC